MNTFVVELEDRPGQLARVTEALAGRGVNILVYGLSVAGQWAMAFVANDEQRARSALDDAGISYRELPVMHVTMEDKPGQSASVSRRLADAGVNIELWVPVDTSQGNFTVAVAVDKAEVAREALAEQLTTWSYR